MLHNQSLEQTRLSVLAEHLRAENDHDIDAIIATYGPDPTVVINGRVFSGFDSIKVFHERMGFGQQGSFSDLLVEERKRYITSEAVIIEQTLHGRHTGNWQGLAPTGRPIKLPVCTVYLFDQDGLLAGERVYFDNSVLQKQLAS